MSDLHVRSDSVDVEQIMKQIRTRIREKRGSDYTEQELQQLASVKLEQFADPSGLRSDLLEQFQRRSSEPATYPLHHGIRRWILMALHPLLKFLQKRLMADLNLYFEIIHNLVVEVTRLGIEVQNLKMRVESLSSRVDFDERRARALEGVVQYRPDAAPRHRPQPAPQHRQAPAPAPASPAWGAAPAAASVGNEPAITAAAPAPAQVEGGPAAGPAGGQPGRPDGDHRRRRRRRRRRPGQTMGDRGPQGQAAGGGASQPASSLEGGAADDRDADGPDGDDGAADQ